MSNTHHHNKKRHKVNGHSWPYDYCSTPGQWVRQMMTKPARRRAHLLESQLRNRPVAVVQDAPEVDRVEWPLARKPHVYYW